MFQHIKLHNNKKLLPTPKNHFTKGHRPRVSTTLCRCQKTGAVCARWPPDSFTCSASA